MKLPSPIREMAIKAAEEDEPCSINDKTGLALFGAFFWEDNTVFSDSDFWSAVNEDAIHHGLWG